MDGHTYTHKQNNYRISQELCPPRHDKLSAHHRGISMYMLCFENMMVCIISNMWKNVTQSVGHCTNTRASDGHNTYTRNWATSHTYSSSSSSSYCHSWLCPWALTTAILGPVLVPRLAMSLDSNYCHAWLCPWTLTTAMCSCVLVPCLAMSLDSNYCHAWLCPCATLGYVLGL